MKTWRDTIFQLAFLAGLHLIAGCGGEQVRLCSPEVPAGRITGTIRLGRTPVVGIVRAERVREPGQSSAVIDVRPDSASGCYALDVPAGRYVVSYAARGYWSEAYEYSAAGLRYGDLPPDTLIAADFRQPIEVNFDLATVRMHLDLAPQLDGETAALHVHPRGLARPSSWRSFVAGSGSEIAGGKADIEVWGVLPGQSKIEIILGERDYRCSDCIWDGEHFWQPGTRDSTESPWILLERGGSVELSCSVHPEPARIEGRIDGAWLQVGSYWNPIVTLFGEDSTLVVGPRSVADDGTFAIDVYLPQPVKVLVEQEGLTRWIGGDRFRTAQVFALSAGQTVAGARLTESALLLDATGSGMGFGIDPQVQLVDSRTGGLVGTWTSVMGPSESTLRILNVTPGSYRLFLDRGYREAEGWLPQWYDRARRPEDARVFEIRGDGDVVTLPVALERGGRIAGVVPYPNDPQARFDIFVTRADDPARWARTLTWTDHEFSFTGLPDGDWKVGAWRETDDRIHVEPPAGTIWYPSTSNWFDAEVLTIHNSSEVTGVKIQVP